MQTLLLKLTQRVAMIMAAMGGLGFKPKGFSFYLRKNIAHRQAVLANLYQKRLDDTTYIDRRAGLHSEWADEYTSEFIELDEVLKGRGTQKRITRPKRSTPGVK